MQGLDGWTNEEILTNVAGIGFAGELYFGPQI